MNAKESDAVAGACVVLSTFANEDDAARLGRTLVERRLVACVNLIRNVRSIYRWRSRIGDEAEVLAVMKTSRDRLPELIDALPALHPYEVPEILALDVAKGGASYLDWLARETSALSTRDSG